MIGFPGAVVTPHSFTGGLLTTTGAFHLIICAPALASSAEGIKSTFWLSLGSCCTSQPCAILFNQSSSTFHGIVILIEMFLIALQILFHMLWNQPENDSGFAWVDAAVDSSPQNLHYSYLPSLSPRFEHSHSGNPNLPYHPIFPSLRIRDPRRVKWK